MKNIQKPFSDFIQQLIFKELSDTQQEQFLIEGEELITSLFTLRTEPVYTNDKEYNFDFGLSPSALAVEKRGITFYSIILTSFSLIESLYLNETHPNSMRYKDVDYWKEFFSSNNAGEAEVELLCSQYKTQFANILECI